MHLAALVVRRIALCGLLALAILVAPRPAGMAVARAASCPTGPVSIASVAATWMDGTGPDCYGGRTLAYRAWVQPGCDECGGAEAAALTPLWLDGLEGSIVILSDGPAGAQLPVHIPPALGRCSPVRMLAACPFRASVGRWVTVGGHFDGPVAATCRYLEHPPGPGFSRADAVAACRQAFIVLSIATGSGRMAGSPPDTATLSDGGGPAAPRDGVDPPWLLGCAALTLLLARRPRRTRPRG